MKIWIKMIISLILGSLIGLFVPDLKISDDTTLFTFLSNIALNLLLYLTPLYILINFFVGLHSIMTKKISNKIFSKFTILIISSLFFSIVISVLIINIPFLKPVISVIEQQKEKRIEVISITKLINSILNNNIFSIFNIQTTLLLPILFISTIFALASYISAKKGEYFTDTVVSFSNVLQIIAKEFLEFFPFGAIFIIATVIKTESITKHRMDIIIKPLISLLIVAVLVIIAYCIVLRILYKKNNFKFFIATLGSSLIAFTTGNTASSTIAITEHIKSNLGVNRDIADTLTPLSIIFNKSGTIIASTITLFSLMTILTPDRLTLPLQATFIVLLFLFSFLQDGTGSLSFLVIVASILKINFLHLEEHSYLLFYAAIPLFSRIGALIDSLSSSLFIMLTEKLAMDKTNEVKYIDYI